MGLSFALGVQYTKDTTQPKIRIIETTVYRFPNTPPYTEFNDPIDFNQAILLLEGMKVSHEQMLNWEFESDPGFGVADKEFQKACIKWYNQLIDYTWRHK